MAGAMFEGLRDILQPEADVAYVPGSGDEMVGLTRLADAFLDVFFSYWGEIPWLDSAGKYGDLLSGYGPLDQHLFLDALLMRFGERSVDEPNYSVADVLTPVIRAMYALGHSEFTLDFAHLPRLQSKMPTCLYGTEERPIRLTMHGDVDEIGYNLRHCIVDFYGDCRTAGEHAYHCEFRLHGEVRGEAGDMAFGSDFYLESPHAVSIKGRNSFCRYHLAGTPTLEEKGRIIGSPSFSSMWNTLLVPDGNDSWTEVRP